MALTALLVANNIITDLLLKINYDMSSSESEDEVDKLYTVTYAQVSQLRGKRRKIIRIEGYVENVVPTFSTRQFKEHFRMTPNSFQILENKLSLSLSKPNNIGRPSIPPRVQILATLWLLATPDSYRCVLFKYYCIIVLFKYCRN